MKKILSSGLLVLLASVIFASGCKGTKALLPNVSGKACEIMVVIDKDYWEGPLGAEVRLVLADEVPYLPQKEPLFNLSNVPLSGFSDLFRVHRNIMLLQVKSPYFGFSSGLPRRMVPYFEKARKMDRRNTPSPTIR